MNASTEVYGGSGATEVARVHSEMPVTGLDLELLVVSAILLILAGFVMNWAARRADVS